MSIPAAILLRRARQNRVKALIRRALRSRLAQKGPFGPVLGLGQQAGPLSAKLRFANRNAAPGATLCFLGHRQTSLFRA